MKAQALYTFEEFRLANSPKPIFGLDYVRSIYKSFALPADFILCFSKLYRPELRLESGHIFVADMFEQDRYTDLSQGGKMVAVAQYWMNLLEITGLFDGLSEVEALGVAQGIAAAWNSIIDATCAGLTGRASAIHDQATGEVFVTIGCIPPPTLQP